jgi:dTDP-4-dehydrorhamnose 3,5-epimerase
MLFTELKLPGAFIIDVERLEDDRGFFGRIWCKQEFKEHGLNTSLVQANVSYNRFNGTLRGMHFQKKPFQETKLVRCTKGAIYDVIVDIRPQSRTFKQWIGVELNEVNRRMLYVPEGFAHGYLTLQDETEVYYMITEYYAKTSEGGILWNEPEISIEWPQKPKIISDKDLDHPPFDLDKIL